MGKKLKTIHSDIYHLAFVYLERKGITPREASTLDVINAIVKIAKNATKAGYRISNKRRKK